MDWLLREYLVKAHFENMAKATRTAWWKFARPEDARLGSEPKRSVVKKASKAA